MYIFYKIVYQSLALKKKTIFIDLPPQYGFILAFPLFPRSSEIISPPTLLLLAAQNNANNN